LELAHLRVPKGHFIERDPFFDTHNLLMEHLRLPFGQYGLFGIYIYHTENCLHRIFDIPTPVAGDGDGDSM